MQLVCRPPAFPDLDDQDEIMWRNINFKIFTMVSATSASILTVWLYNNNYMIRLVTLIMLLNIGIRWRMVTWMKKWHKIQHCHQIMKQLVIYIISLLSCEQLEKDRICWFQNLTHYDQSYHLQKESTTCYQHPMILLIHHWCQSGLAMAWGQDVMTSRSTCSTCSASKVQGGHW